MLRVAVRHTDPNHPNAGVAAYRLGSIDDFTHPITGETTPAHAVAVSLIDAAREEFPEPEYEVWVESLEDYGTEDCYVCGGRGQVPTVGGEGDQLQVVHNDCTVCLGTGQTARSYWAAVDEQAVRDRAGGQDVEIPLVDQLPTANQHTVGTEQVQAATQE